MSTFAYRTDIEWVEGCSICSTGDRRCSTDADGIWCNCYKIHDGAIKVKEGSLGLYGVHLLKPTYQSELNRFSKTLMNSNSRIEVITPKPTSIKADPVLCDEVYQTLIDEWVLSEKHLDYLRTSRKFPLSEIVRQSYRTSSNSAKISELLIKKFGQKIFDVPGVRKNGQLPVFVVSDRLIIPTFDLNGKIANVKIRNEDESLKNNPDLPRYFYASSKKIRGASANPSVHVVNPIEKKSELVWLTEGEIKAHTISFKIGVIAISIPGVGFWELAVDCLKEMGAMEVVVAFDADLITNNNVASKLIDLITKLKEEKFNVKIAQWY